MATTDQQSSRPEHIDSNQRKRTPRECRWRIMGRDVKSEDRPYIVCLGSSERDLMRRLKKLFGEKSLDELNKIDSIWIEHFHGATPFRAAEWFPIEEIMLQHYRLRAAALKQVAMYVAAGRTPIRPAAKRRRSHRKPGTSHRRKPVPATTCQTAVRV